MSAAVKAAKRKKHLEETAVADLPLQHLLWKLDCDYDLFPHQFAAVRFVAGVPPVRV